MNKFFRNTLIAGFAVCSFSAVRAAEKDAPKVEASLGWIMGTGNDMDSMKDGFGYTFGMSYHIPTSHAFSYRIHGNAMVFQGAPGTGLTDGRPHFYGGLDLSAPISGKLSGFGGMLAISWNQAPSISVTDTRFKDTFNASGTRQSSRLDGAKLGARVGLEYHFDKSASATLTWTVAQANLAFNPSWLTVGMTLKF